MMRRRRHVVLPPSDDPEPWRIEAARRHGYSLDDLRRVRRETGVWPTDEQVKAAAGRRVSAILNRRDGDG
jgi:hypothetical protein